MKLIQLALLCLAIIATSSHSTKTIMDFWKEEDAAFPLSQLDKVVLMIGDTGTGKTTTTLLLTNSYLESKKDRAGSSLYHIYDKNGKIDNTTSQSQTIIPEAYFDLEYNTTYYDCPGFQDSRSPDHDITVGYLVNKLLTHAKSFKIVLVVNHSNVKISETQTIFPDFIKTIVKLFKNIDTFRDGIAMIATKVKKTIVRVPGKLVTVNDTSVVQQVSDYLRELRNSTIDTLSENKLPEDERNFNQQKLKLLEILLEKNDKTENGYDRIGIVRATIKGGSLVNNVIIQREKRNIQKMIRENLQYVSQSKGVEFGVVVSIASLVYVDDLMERVMNIELLNDLSNIFEEVKQYYQEAFTKSQYINEISRTIIHASDVFNSIPFTEPLSFLREIVSRTGPITTDSTVRNTVKHIKYIEFLLKIKEKNLSIPVTFTEQFNDVEQYIQSQYDASLLQWVKNLLEKSMLFVVKGVSTEIEQFYNDIEERTAEVYILNRKLSKAHRHLSKVDVTKPQSLANAINELEIRISEKMSENVSHTIINMTYFPDIVGKYVTLMEPSQKEFQKTLQGLKESVLWYNYMMTFDSSIVSSEYATKDNGVDILQSIMNSCADATYVRECGFDQLSWFIPNNSDLLKNLQTLKLTSTKKNILKTILSYYTQKPTISCQHSSNMLVVGAMFRMSQITNDQTCFPKATSIVIYATISIIFDSSFTKTGDDLQVAITSPVWIVVGTQKITLRGNAGKRKSDAKDCNGCSSSQGQDGEAGYPGSTGGKFFGLGHVFHNGENLTIESEGGKGGPGQNGGKGQNGINGTLAQVEGSEVQEIFSCLYTELFGHHCYDKFIYQKGMDYESDQDGYNLSIWRTGKTGTNGGDGGNSGIGGYGGKAGRIELIEMYEKSHINQVTRDGASGDCGSGGEGGDAAIRTIIQKIRMTLGGSYFAPSLKLQVDPPLIQEMTKPGRTGFVCLGTENRLFPKPAHDHSRKRQIINNLKHYSKKDIKTNVRRSKIRDFIYEKLEKNPKIIKLYT